ncbi:stealth family protein [Clostridium sp. cel8]|jgi:acyl carrier protein phosphodiesterase|uniref:Stealth CR1 domain-containing protein n=1 Tax=Clostridium sp. cel8 TaxID=2663123 RepID=UPI0015F45270|nr:Stealth CR1 domain-containing protein [Clostridium sp. cel8]MBA5850029.1 stealth family protein [Clostridium sp. cel8]
MVDLVITWVDGSDKKWLADRKKYELNTINECRYRDWNLLKYWFRCIERNAPWFHKVYFVTYGHIPTWLNTKYEKLEVVNHNQIIKQEYLPTFNSCAIEMNLHRISGLSEKFIYFNDDMFVNAETLESDFFINDLPCDNKNLGLIWKIGKESTKINYNCAKIVQKYFKLNYNKYEVKYNKLKNSIKKFLYPHEKPIVALIPDHVPTSYLKSTYSIVWEKEYNLLDKVSSHRFRTSNDVSQWIFQFWQIMSNNYIERDHSITKYYEIELKNIKNIVDEIKNHKHKLICLNDSEKTNHFNEIQKKLIECFEKIYPTKSKFEL